MRKIIQKTYKYRLKPTGLQEALFAQFAGCDRYVYNDGLLKIKSAFAEGVSIPTYYELAGMLPALKRSEATSWLKAVHSQILQQSLMDLCRALFAYYTGKKKKKLVGFPKFRRKGQHDTFRFPQTVVMREQ